MLSYQAEDIIKINRLIAVAFAILLLLIAVSLSNCTSWHEVYDFWAHHAAAKNVTMDIRVVNPTSINMLESNSRNASVLVKYIVAPTKMSFTGDSNNLSFNLEVASPIDTPHPRTDIFLYLPCNANYSIKTVGLEYWYNTTKFNVGEFEGPITITLNSTTVVSKP